DAAPRTLRSVPFSLTLVALTAILAAFPAALVRADTAAAPGPSAQAPAAPPTPGPGAPPGSGEAEPDEGGIVKARAAWFRDTHAGPDGVIPFAARSRAQAELRRNLASGLLTAATAVAGTTWVSVGPDAMHWGDYLFSGRVTSIATHPTDAN